MPARARRYELVVFDLDGTLVDSFDFFVQAHNRLAPKHRLRPIAPHEAAAWRHCPPREIMALVGLARWRLPWVARDFVRLMRDTGGGLRLFPGTDQALRHLHAQGLRLAVVSSNSADNCRRLLGPELCQRMACIDGGASLFGKRTRLQRVLRRLHVPPHQAIYVGDQLTDADAARAAGLAFGAVSWGYGAPSALARARPDHTFDCPAALCSLAGAPAA
jgi:phosphoglycolate phosphatase